MPQLPRVAKWVEVWSLPSGLLVRRCLYTARELPTLACRLTQMP